MAEWLGIGLQNQVQRFESARDLKKIADAFCIGYFFNRSSDESRRFEIDQREIREIPFKIIETIEQSLEASEK